MLLKDITPAQLSDITVIERNSSILSLVGCVWISVTFLCLKEFRKPINRLVFFASIGNIFANAATIMSRDFLQDADQPACQIQAFFIQMFMPADAIWTFAMAANVWLTFYHKYDTERLRRLEKWYFVLCYGLPFVPALIFSFIESQSKGKVYGNATLWCWIGPEWEILRLSCFYAPVWIVILATIAIYLRAGKDIYTKRQQLRAFHISPPQPMPILSNPFTQQKATEVIVTTETATTVDTLDVRGQRPHRDLRNSNSRPESIAKPNHTYHVTVTSQTLPVPSDDGIWTYHGNHKSNPVNGVQHPTNSTGRRSSFTDDSQALPPISPQTTNPYNNASSSIPRRQATMEANNAAWAYTKVAVLFFFAMMITWIPSSANRVYSVIHVGEVSLALQFASAFVLPLQGFWNAVIYTMTSVPAVKKLWRSLCSGRQRVGVGGSFFTDDRGSWRSSTNKSKKSNKSGLMETESMTELQASNRVLT